MSEWISVDEQMPMHEQSVDIWYKPYNYRIADVMYVDYEDSQAHFYDESNDSIIMLSDVTHWMPLPSPPEDK